MICFCSSYINQKLGHVVEICKLLIGAVCVTKFPIRQMFNNKIQQIGGQL
jgi:hypothetical protein